MVRKNYIQICYKVILIILLVFANSIMLLANTKPLSSVSSLLVKDLNNGKFLANQNINKKMSPASLTKIMTAMLAIESNRLEEDVIITKESTSVEKTTAGFVIDERVKLKDLLNAMLINSSNDAAMAIAVHLGNGNSKMFINAMNVKAKSLGMKNTNFTNPCGFDKNNNLSTAEDLLKLTEYAIKNPLFNEIVKKEFAFFNTDKKMYFLKSHNKLLLENNVEWIGIKTGYTNKAGPCLIARYKENNKDLLIISLKSKDRFKIAKLYASFF